MTDCDNAAWTVVFDLDGTLADTAADLLAAANACFRGLGLGDLLDLKTDAGTALRGGRMMLRLGFSRLGPVDEAEVDRQYPLLIAHYTRALHVHTRLYPGARDTVLALKARGHPVAVCTNKPEAQALALLASLGVLDDFDAVLGADTLPVKKPDPEHLRETVRRAGGDPARCILVGDSDTDRNTAANAGVPCVLVTFGPDGAQMPALNPAALIDSYNDLPDVVARLIAD